MMNGRVVASGSKKILIDNLIHMEDREISPQWGVEGPAQVASGLSTSNVQSLSSVSIPAKTPHLSPDLISTRSLIMQPHISVRVTTRFLYSLGS